MSGSSMMQDNTKHIYHSIPMDAPGAIAMTERSPCCSGSKKVMTLILASALLWVIVLDIMLVVYKSHHLGSSHEDSRQILAIQMKALAESAPSNNELKNFPLASPLPGVGMAPKKTTGKYNAATSGEHDSTTKYEIKREGSFFLQGGGRHVPAGWLSRRHAHVPALPPAPRARLTTHVTTTTTEVNRGHDWPPPLPLPPPFSLSALSPPIQLLPIPHMFPSPSRGKHRDHSPVVSGFHRMPGRGPWVHERGPWAASRIISPWAPPRPLSPPITFSSGSLWDVGRMSAGASDPAQLMSPVEERGSPWDTESEGIEHATEASVETDEAGDVTHSDGVQPTRAPSAEDKLGLSVEPASFLFRLFNTIVNGPWNITQASGVVHTFSGDSHGTGLGGLADITNEDDDDNDGTDVAETIIDLEM